MNYARLLPLLLLISVANAADKGASDLLSIQKRQALLSDFSALLTVPPVKELDLKRDPFADQPVQPFSLPETAISSVPTIQAQTVQTPVVKPDPLADLKANIKPAGSLVSGDKTLVILNNHPVVIGSTFFVKTVQKTYSVKLVRMNPPYVVLSYNDEEFSLLLRSPELRIDKSPEKPR